MTSGIVRSGMHVAITGKLPIPRSEAIVMLENAGAIYMPRVTRRTDVLLVGHIRSATGMTRKLFNAKRLLSTGHAICLYDGEIYLRKIM